MYTVYVHLSQQEDTTHAHLHRQAGRQARAPVGSACARQLQALPVTIRAAWNWSHAKLCGLPSTTSSLSLGASFRNAQLLRVHLRRTIGSSELSTVCSLKPSGARTSRGSCWRYRRRSPGRSSSSSARGWSPVSMVRYGEKISSGPAGHRTASSGHRRSSCRRVEEASTSPPPVAA